MSIISTHALTWSATGFRHNKSAKDAISTHALTWSATLFAGIAAVVYHISTHALTWSATGARMNCSVCVPFQLTHSRGVRRVNRFCIRIQHEFQLTHSRGVRHTILDDFWKPPDFNSRTHVECDQNVVVRKGIALNFNSRTHVECDLIYAPANSTCADFNSRTHVECDLLTPMR